MSEFKRIPPEQALALRAQGAVVVDIRDPQALPLATSRVPSTWITTRLPSSSAMPTSMPRPWWSATTATPARALPPTW